MRFNPGASAHVKKFRPWVLLAATASGGGFATEPLHDHVVIEGKAGLLLPETCCWVKLPPSPALSAAKRSQRCSALGGPVGNFRLQDNKLILVSLRTCSGELPLQQFYAGAPKEMAATWLSGKFRVELDPLCTTGAGRMLHATTMQLVVDAGNLVTSQKQTRDGAACHGP